MAKGWGLQGQIEAFFKENPDEYLMPEDICLKWAVNKRQVNAALSHLRKKKVIDTGRDGLIISTANSGFGIL